MKANPPRYFGGYIVFLTALLVHGVPATFPQYVDFIRDSRRKYGTDGPFAAGNEVDDLFFFVENRRRCACIQLRESKKNCSAIDGVLIHVQAELPPVNWAISRSKAACSILVFRSVSSVCSVALRVELSC